MQISTVLRNMYAQPFNISEYQKLKLDSHISWESKTRGSVALYVDKIWTMLMYD